MVRCWTRSCGRTSTRGGGSTPLSSSSNNEKNSVSPATLFFWLRRALFVAVFCLRGAEWCVATATAWADDCCSCRQGARSRRLFAAEHQDTW